MANTPNLVKICSEFAAKVASIAEKAFPKDGTISNVMERDIRIEIDASTHIMSFLLTIYFVVMEVVSAHILNASLQSSLTLVFEKRGFYKGLLANISKDSTPQAIFDILTRAHIISTAEKISELGGLQNELQKTKEKCLYCLIASNNSKIFWLMQGLEKENPQYRFWQMQYLAQKSLLQVPRLFLAFKMQKKCRASLELERQITFLQTVFHLTQIVLLCT